MTTMPIQIKNNSAVAYWIIVSIIMAVIAVMTYVFLRDGPPVGYSEPLLITATFGLAWLFGFGAVSHAFSKPCVLVQVDKTNIRITLRYLFKTLRCTYGPHEVLHSGITESKDSEGDPHFTGQVTMADGRKIELAEGSRDVCETVVSQFESALRGQSRDNSGLVARNKPERDSTTKAHPSSLIKGDRSAVVSVFVISLLFFIIGSVGAIGSWAAFRLDTDIQKNGPRAVGHVTRKVYLKSDEGSDYRVEYDFDLPSGTQIHARHDVSKKLWSAIEEGQTLTIAYSRENPNRNFPLGAGENSLVFTVFISLFFAMFAVFGGFIMWCLVFAKPSVSQTIPGQR